ncbi:MAG: hypothetical protein AB1556_16520, partial [Bacillota bacterium]
MLINGVAVNMDVAAEIGDGRFILVGLRKKPGSLSFAKFLRDKGRPILENARFWRRESQARLWPVPP